MFWIVIVIAITVYLWMVSGLVAYLIIRWGYRSNEWTWDRGEALFTALACSWCGPFGMVQATCMFCRPGSISQWLNKTSEW